MCFVPAVCVPVIMLAVIGVFILFSLNWRLALTALAAQAAPAPPRPMPPPVRSASQ